MASVMNGEENGVLFINGHKFNGFIDNAFCPKCSEARIYSDDYDAYFCAACNEWLESTCSDVTCEYCKSRPSNPLDRLKNDPFRDILLRFMSYYIRFLATDTKNISLRALDSWLKQKDAAYSIDHDNESDQEAEITYKGNIYGQIEINRSEDDIFEDDINLLKEAAQDAEGEQKSEVLRALDETRTMFALRVLWQGRETEETLQKLNPLWEWLFANHEGILHAENEGFYNASDLILETD